MIATEHTSARQRILNVAVELFHQQGIRAVGIDTIIERSGVAKATLYRHFPSKDDLIVAYLKDRQRSYWEWFDQAIKGSEGSPRQQLQDLIDAFIEREKGLGYRGCPNVNVITEFPNQEHPAHQQALANKQEMRARIYEIAQQAQARDPDELADQLFLLMEGIIGMTHLLGATDQVNRASSMAALLIAAQCPQQQA